MSPTAAVPIAIRSTSYDSSTKTEMMNNLATVVARLRMLDQFSASISSTTFYGDGIK
jgi:hypothetical protein